MDIVGWMEKSFAWFREGNNGGIGEKSLLFCLREAKIDGAAMVNLNKNHWGKLGLLFVCLL